MKHSSKVQKMSCPWWGKIQQTVEEVLESSSMARNDDSVLYAMVCERLNDNVKRYSFSDVMSNREYFGLPDFNTVRNTRSRVVQRRGELGALPGVRSNRGRRLTYLDYTKI